jgi:hypothetical protein
MYQFGLVPPDQIDALSAKFVVYYFVASLPRKPDLTPFTVYNSRIGLDGIHARLLDTYHRIKVKPRRKVTSFGRSEGAYRVVTASGPPLPADQVVFAINPRRVLDIVRNTDENARLQGVLQRMPYVEDVTVAIQKGHSAYMPTQRRDWSVSNVIVAGDPAPSHYMLTAWFGPLRDEPLGRDFFKSWGSPALHPPAQRHHECTHELMVGTPGFIRAREELRSTLQGVNGLWFSGGYLWGYDSQNACLNSAKRTAIGILQRYGLALQADGVDGDDLPTSGKASPFSEAIRNVIRAARPGHAAMGVWREFWDNFR